MDVGELISHTTAQKIRLDDESGKVTVGLKSHWLYIIETSLVLKAYLVVQQ